MDPTVGLAIFLLEVASERLKLLESDQWDLGSWVDERGAWFYVKSNEQFLRVVRKAERNPVRSAESNIQSVANRWRPRVGSRRCREDKNSNIARGISKGAI